MKFTTTLALAIATLVVATPTPDEGVDVSPRDNVLEPRRGCSGSRLPTEKCGGRFLAEQHSFHNCKHTTKGKCCAKNRDGTGGVDVNKVTGEKCHYCFSGTCSVVR